MSIDHYGPNDDRNKWACEDGFIEKELETIKPTDVSGSFSDIKQGKCIIDSVTKENISYDGKIAKFEFKFSKTYFYGSFKFPLYVNFGEP